MKDVPAWDSYADTLYLDSALKDPWLGTRVGPYHINELIGTGGMGIVYKARDESLQRDVAIKFLNESLTNDEGTVSRLLEEARLAARLDHPGVIGILMTGVERGRRYVAMPFAAGGSLADALKEKNFSKDRTLQMVWDMAKALQQAHSIGIIHRDIKPENVMLDSQGKIKISDFGMATIKNSTDRLLTENGQLLGTPYTISPEQCSDEGVDERTDIYSLGITFFRMLTGRWPFDGETSIAVVVQHLSKELPDPKDWGVHLSDDVIYVLKKMTAKRPEDRYHSMKEVARALERLIKNQGVKPVGNLQPKHIRWKQCLFFALMIAGGLWLLVHVDWSFSKNQVLLQPEGIAKGAAEEPAQTINKLKKLYISSKQSIVNSKMENETQWMQGLSALDQMFQCWHELTYIDPIFSERTHWKSELEDLRFDLVTKISGAIINPLVEHARFESSLTEFKRLPMELINLPRVAQYAFGVIERHTDSLLSRDHVESHVQAERWLDLAWTLLTPAIRKSGLISREERLRQNYRQSENDSTRLQRRLERLWRHREMVRDFQKKNRLEEAFLLIQNIQSELSDINFEHQRLLTSWKAHFENLNEHLRELHSIQVSYDQATSNSQWSDAKSFLTQWDEMDSSISAKTEMVSFIKKELNHRVHAYCDEENYESAFSSLISLIDFDPGPQRTAQARDYFKDKTSHHDQHTKWVKQIENRILWASGRPISLDTQLPLIHLQWKNFHQNNWDELLAGIPKENKTPPQKWMMGKVSESKARQLIEKKSFAAAWDQAEAVEENLPFLELGKDIKNQISILWTQNILATLQDIESDSEELLLQGLVDEALARLGRVDVIEFNAIDVNLEIEQMMDSLNKRRDDLLKYSALTEKIRQEIDLGNWKIADNLLNEARSTSSSQSVDLSLKKFYDHKYALFMLSKEENVFNRLKWSWEAWLNRLEETQELLFSHNQLRHEAASQTIRDVMVLEPQVLDALDIFELDSAQVTVDLARTKIDFVMSDFSKEPSIDLSSDFQSIIKHWEAIANRLSKAQLAKQLAAESKVKYQDFISMATQATSDLNLNKALDAYKNARLHAGHLTEKQLSELDALIARTEDQLQDQRQLREDQKNEKNRRQAIKLEVDNFKARLKEENWNKAIEHLAAYDALIKPSDQMLLPDNLDTVAWKLRLQDRLQDLKDWTKLQSTWGVSAEDNIMHCQRFKRQQAGNYYVRQGHVQEKIEEFQKSLDEKQARILDDITQKTDTLLESGQNEEALKIAVSAWKKNPGVAKLSVLVCQLLDQDMIEFDGGVFEAGSELGERVGKEETPPWKRLVGSFSIGRFEVTHLQYKRYVDATAEVIPASWVNGKIPVGQELMPVTGISFFEAQKYAKWIGCRLPSEFEWEWSARNGERHVRWPWGNDEDGTRSHLNSKEGRLVSVLDKVQGRSSKGLAHMAGNAAEWTVSDYKSYPYIGFWGKKIESQVLIEGAKTVRGGSLFDDLWDCRTTSRKGVDVNERPFNVGFRLCRK